MAASVYINQALVDVTSLPDTTKEVLLTLELLDNHYQTLSKMMDLLLTKTSANTKQIQSIKVILEDIAEKKILLALRNYDLIDQHIRVLDKRIGTIDMVIKHRFPPSLQQIEQAIEGKPSIGRKRKKPIDTPNVEEDIGNSIEDESTEPVYCTCHRVAYGDMIACDNDDCSTEWFHYNCVGLTKKPKKAWYCPQCRPKFV